MAYEMGRRDLLKLTAAAALAGTGVKTASGAVEAPRFFTPEEFQLTEELTEMIIPADELSGGAKAARVTAFIDGQFAEAFEPEAPQKFRAGLKLVDDLAQKTVGTTFVKATPEQRLAILMQMSQNEREAKTPEEVFFRDLKNDTVRVFYTSKIGIHDALDYKGNVYQTGEYSGTLPAHPALEKPAGSA